MRNLQMSAEKSCVLFSAAASFWVMKTSRLVLLWMLLNGGVLTVSVALLPRSPSWSGPSGLAWLSSRTHWKRALGVIGGTAMVSGGLLLTRRNRQRSNDCQSDI